VNARTALADGRAVTHDAQTDGSIRAVVRVRNLQTPRVVTEPMVSRV